VALNASAKRGASWHRRADLHTGKTAAQIDVVLPS